MSVTELDNLTGQNGDGDRQITKPERVKAIVHDESEYAVYLDTGKFEHCWRVAQMFSNSKLVPQHFRNEPSDCFIALEMAMRLGVNPLMFMQGTYIVHGKPGMEAKLAIALINSSGLFRGPIRYVLDGQGDNRGCHVQAVIKETGEMIEGPRVTIATAKAEGWFSRDGSKWKTIPDMMLQYRAASWFGRLYCPQRLMGMQTVDEIHDAGQTAPEPAMAKERGRNLKQRLTAPQTEAAAESTPPVSPPASKGDVTTQPEDAGGGEPPIDEDSASVVDIDATLSKPWPQVVEFLWATAEKGAFVPEREIFDKWLQLKVKVGAGKLGKESEIKLSHKQAWYREIMDGKAFK